jgi:hypothetical protein
VGVCVHHGAERDIFGFWLFCKKRIVRAIFVGMKVDGKEVIGGGAWWNPWTL